MAPLECDKYYSLYLPCYAGKVRVHKSSPSLYQHWIYFQTNLLENYKLDGRLLLRKWWRGGGQADTMPPLEQGQLQLGGIVQVSPSWSCRNWPWPSSGDHHISEQWSKYCSSNCLPASAGGGFHYRAVGGTFRTCTCLQSWSLRTTSASRPNQNSHLQKIRHARG